MSSSNQQQEVIIITKQSSSSFIKIIKYKKVFDNFKKPKAKQEQTRNEYFRGTNLSKTIKTNKSGLS